MDSCEWRWEMASIEKDFLLLLYCVCDFCNIGHVLLRMPFSQGEEHSVSSDMLSLVLRHTVRGCSQQNKEIHVN